MLFLQNCSFFCLKRSILRRRLEGTARYVGLFLAPAKAFLPFRHKRGGSPLTMIADGQRTEILVSNIGRNISV